ncbi:LysR family transcriptional regulator [Gallaecimonas kandeliae]|uniref:LysR family transcriptional regulator n=1 Tax=Gallaecimonas kandeliae TaxID=3029055 RepID=UPI00264869CC|nr:LysR family transcriptional regulator [Gallaecimonas kandeliae]WKE64850.1 LysR family transcriptional regulator [Gallaecimonas kandeliae]
MEDLYYFSCVMRFGQLKSAALHLRVSVPTLSRAIRRLEQRLNTSLFNRHSNNLKPTAGAMQLHQQCCQQFLSLEALLRGAREQSQSVEGPLRIIAPVAFARSMLARGLLDSFRHSYPKIELRLDLCNHRLALDETDFDLAILIGELPDSPFLCKRIGSLAFILAAAPALLASTPPLSLPELQQFPHLVFDPIKHWHFRSPQGEQQEFMPRRDFSCTDAEICALEAIQGKGLYYGPKLLIKEALHSGELVPVLPQFQPLERKVSLLWPDRLVSLRTRLMIDYLAEHFPCCVQ